MKAMTEPICSSDRWTCPQCHRTVVIDATDADCLCAIRAVQQRHADGHRRAAAVLGRLGLPAPTTARPRRRGNAA